MQKIILNPWLISLLILTGSVLLFVGGPDYYSTRSMKHFWDIGHIVYFALLALLLCRWSVISRLTLVQQWLLILSITLVLGITIELLQYGTSRSPNMGDVLRDINGSLLALVFGPARSKIQSARRRLYTQISVCLLTLYLLSPFIISLLDETIARHQFPLLSGFETPFEINRWHGGNRLSVVSLPSVAKGKLLRLALTTEKYSGVAFKYFDNDWTTARHLKISFYNPDTTALHVVLRIHDAQHNDGHEEHADRYNNVLLLTPGWNQIEIDLAEVKNKPAQRQMDMQHIRGLGIFVLSLPAARLLYIDNVQLTY